MKKGSFLSILLLPFLIILLCWPAVLNGGAIFFYDSLSYLGSAATGFREVLGLDVFWDDASTDVAVPPDMLEKGPPKTAEPQAGGAEGAAAPAGTEAAPVQSQTQDAPAIMAGRSIYYGAFLFAAGALGSLWLGIILQALIVIASIYMTYLARFPAASRATFLTLIVLGVFSSLPFYVSYLMPDFLTGVVILAVANLMAFGTQMRLWMVLAWGLLLLFGLVSHTSHILIAGLMVVGWMLLQVIRRRTIFTLSLTVCVGALGAAVMAEMAFFKVIETMYGVAPVRPPFLMARTISDGPGYDYLVDNCDRHDLRICDFIDVLPQPTDDILWSRDSKTGVYAISDVQTKTELNDQQMEFVLAVLRYDPLGQVQASARGFLQQLSMISLDEFFYTSNFKNYLYNKVPVEEQDNLSRTLLYRDSFPLLQANIIIVTTVILFMFYIIYSCIKLVVVRKTSNDGITATSWFMTNRASSIERQHIQNDVLIFVAFVLVGLCLNAAVTGILSALHDRYQARVIWLVPFLGMYLACFRNKKLIQPAKPGPGLWND